MPERFVDLGLPCVSGKVACVSLAAACAEAAGFLTIAFASGDRDIEADQRAEITDHFAARPQDFHSRPFPGQGSRDLAHAGVFLSGVGVDVFEKLGFGFERMSPSGFSSGYSLALVFAGPAFISPPLPGFNRLNRGAGAFQRLF